MFKPTDQQQACLDAAKTGESGVIEALAGTGKTSTLKLIAQDNPNKRFTLIAYNRAIAMDAKKSFPKNVVCGTAHSFAFRSVGARYKHRLPQKGVFPMSLGQIAYHLNIRETVRVGSVGGESLQLKPKVLASIVMQTIDRFCYTDDGSITVRHIPHINGIDEYRDREKLFNALRQYIVLAWEDIKSVNGKLPFQHDYYLKIWALSNPVLSGDGTFFDEAQDANGAIAGVVLKQKGQLIAVGDRNQAIYGWRGAQDAMQNWPAQWRLPLSQSFRFGPAVAEEANKWLELLQSPLKLEGFDKLSTRIDTLGNEAGAVLCRTNAQCIAEALYGQQANKRVSVVGGTKEVKSFAKAARDLQQGRSTDHHQLGVFKSWEQVLEYIKEDGDRSMEVFVNLIDSYGVDTIIEVAETCVDEKTAHDMTVSTAHKSKGREWDDVRVACDFREPSEKDDSDDEQNGPKPEFMINYVTVTRAMRVLDNEGLKWVDNYTIGE